MSKKRSGKKNLQMTRNQRRKAEYAKMRETTWKKRATKAKDSSVGVHKRPCGNPACNSCYTRLIGVGIYLAHSLRLDL